MSRLLALETSTDSCSAALWVQGKLMQRFEIAPRRHAELILTMVDALLSEAELNLQDLDAIAYGMGPGSFMGVRLATGVAQGLAFGVGIPVIPVSSLAALALRACQETGAKHIAAAWDARMGEIYWGCYQVDEGQVEAILTDQLSAPPSILLPAGHDWLLAGNAWQAYQGDLPVNLQDESVLIHPSAAQVAEIAVSKLSSGGAIAADQARPNYLRQRVAYKKSL